MTVPRYRLTGMLDARGIEPDPDGPLVRWADVAPLLSEPVLAALAGYALRLAAWDAAPHEGVHAFEGVEMIDPLQDAIRAERRRNAQP